MALKGKIDELIDIKAIEGQIEKTVTELNKVGAKILDISLQVEELNKRFGAGGLVEYTKNTAQLNITVKEAETHVKKLQAAHEALQRQRDKALQQQQLQIEKERQLHENATKEAKSIDELNAKIKALITLRNRLDLTTEEGRKQHAEYNKIIDESKSKLNELSAAHEKQKDNIGNYKSALDGLKGTFGALAAAVGVTIGVKEVFTRTISATQTVSDRFDATMGGLKESVNLFFRAIASGDWSNLITRMQEAYNEGVRYAKQLDYLRDVARGIKGQTADIDVEIARLKMEARDRKLDVKDREEYVNKIVALYKKRMETEKGFSEEEYNNHVIHLQKLFQLGQGRLNIQQGMLERLLLNEKYYAPLLDKAYLQHLDLVNKATKTSYDEFGVELKKFDKKKYETLLNSLTAEQQLYIKMALSYKDISDEERQRFIELYEAKKNKLKEYYENVGSTFRLRNRIESELNEEEARQTRQQTKVITEEKKKAIEQEEKLAVTKAALIENTLLSEITLLKTKYDKEYNEAAGNYALQLALTEKYLKDIEKLNKKYEAKAISEKSKTINESMQLRSKYTNLLIQSLDDEFEAIITTEEKKKSIQQETFKTIMSLFSAYTSLINSSYDSRLDKINQESEKDKEAKEKELQAAGDNAQAKEEINKKYEAKEKERERERRKIDIDRAKFQKQMAIFEIIINTAKAIVEALKTPWLIPFIAVMGAAQLATVIARPIPQYAKGRKGGDAELAIVGEEGTELIQLKTGEKFFTPDKATLTYLPTGADVISNKELNNIFVDNKDVVNKINTLIETVKNKETLNLNITEKGFYLLSEKGYNKTHYINNKFRK